MSDSEDYEYEYDESDQEAMDAGSGGDEDASFEYTDDEDNQNNDEGEVALENAYYNAKGERDSGEIEEARETFESVIRMEVEQNKKEAFAMYKELSKFYGEDELKPDEFMTYIHQFAQSFKEAHNENIRKREEEERVKKRRDAFLKQMEE